MVETLFLGLFGFLSLFAALVDHFDVVIENCRDDWNHVCLYHSRAHILRSTDPNIDNALKSQIPLPHIHHIFAPSSLEKAYQSLDTSIDCEDVSYPRGRSGEISQMVE
jgi:hypothetical protein